MGLQQSKEELLYQQVSYGNVQGIKSLHRDGARLDWVDREGKSPLIVACMMPNGIPVVKTLLELGADVNAYRPGSHNGTPLHHAAKRGLEQTVNLLLSHGANPYRLNDDCQTALDLARAKGYCNVVRSIESRICLFSGWLRLKSTHVPAILDAFIPPFLSKKIWAVVLPCDHRNTTAPTKFELAMYSDLQRCLGGERGIRRRSRRMKKRIDAKAAQPYATVALWKATIEDPTFNDLDPALVIHDKKARYKLLAANEGDKPQLLHFYNACKGVPQQSVSVALTPARPPLATPTPAPTSACEDEELERAINASIQSAIAEGVPLPDMQPISMSGDSNKSGGSEKAMHKSEAGPSVHIPLTQNRNPADAPFAQNPVIVPSAPPVIVEELEDGPISYPSIDSTPVSLDHLVLDSKGPAIDNQKESSGSCVICLDAPIEGACIPCGHMAGCMHCLKEIKAKNWGCPVCRADIVQVVKIYAV